MNCCSTSTKTETSHGVMIGAESSTNSSALLANIWIVNDQLSDFPYVCLWVDCQQQFQTSDQLATHMDQHLTDYGSAPLTEIGMIRECRLLVTSIDELERHMKMHIFHASRMLNGALMVRARRPQVVSCHFPSSTRLVYQGDPLRCEWHSCLVGKRQLYLNELHAIQQNFTDINQFVGHVQFHVHSLCTVSRNGEDGLYECFWNECQASFRNKAHLLRHVQHHSGDKMCACPFCGAFFSHSAGLLKHVIRRQLVVDSSLICCFCQKAFPDGALLRKHCIRHLKTQKCQFCSLLLSSPFDLNRHIQTVHANFRCYRCEYCDKTFYQRSDLNTHIELHFNDAIHKCRLCGKKFRWSKQLRAHARQHEKGFNPTPYECHLCNSRYVRGSALSKHFKTLHQMTYPIGFSRFQYKKCQDGFFRLQSKVHVRGNFVSNAPRQTDAK